MSSTGVSARTSSGSFRSDDTDEAVVLPPRQLVEEDDPEAFEDQIMAEDGDEPLRSEAKSEDEEEDAAPPPGTSREDLDLVRVYLKHVGKRKLLKAKEEQEIGERIEKARGELQAMLGMIPCAPCGPCWHWPTRSGKARPPPS